MMFDRSISWPIAKKVLLNRAVKSVRADISKKISRRSTRGRGAFTSSRSLIKLYGSSSLSMALTISSSLSSTDSTRA
jgi:hypothetical protein